MAKRSKLREAAEYHAARAVLFSLSLLPLPAACWVGRRLGDLLRLVDRRHRQRAYDHVSARLGLSGKELDDFVKDNFRSYGMTAAEFAKLTRFSAKDIENNIDYNGFDELVRKVTGEGKGVIFVTLHFGNWEWCNSMGKIMGGAGGSIARPLDNSRVNELIRSVRERNGLPIFDKKGAIRKGLAELKRGNILGILIDQDAGSKGMMSPFLGKPASTLTIPAELAIRLESPMVVIVCKRNPPGSAKHFVIDYCPEPFRPNPNADHKEETRRLVDALNDASSEIIRRTPTQWLWIHRRWKSQNTSS